MIKIIKEGTHALCNRCGCEFTYEKEDLKTTVIDPCHFYVECPCCGGFIFLSNTSDGRLYDGN